MTNNQRFCAELAVLFIVGVVVYARAAPQDAGNPKVKDILTVRRIEIVDEPNGNRTMLDGKQIQILDHNGHERAVFGLSGGDNNTVVLLNDNRNISRVELSSSFRFAAPSDVRSGAALTLKGDEGVAVLSMPYGKESREDTGLRIHKYTERLEKP